MEKSSITRGAGEIDGDILVSDSYKKHPRHKLVGTKRVRLIFYLSFFLFVGLASKLYHLQIVSGAEFLGAAEGNRIREASITPPRGVIFDSTGQKLAYNVPDFGLYVVPSDLPENQEEEDGIFQSISNIVKIEKYDLVESFARVQRNTPVLVEVARGLSQEQAVQLEKNSQNWTGVSVRPIEQRSYATSTAFTHILGYTGKMSEDDYEEYKKIDYSLTEHVGKTGIEKQYQKELRGIPGKTAFEVDTFGRATKILKTKPAVVGANVYLNINAEMQKYIYQQLQEMAEKINSPGGSVVVMDPRDGAILSLVSYPSYDNSLFAKGIDHDSYEKLLNDPSNPLFNRPVAGEYPSGSTFKIVVGSAALEEGNVNRYTSVLSTGGIEVNSYWFPDWKYGGHGNTNIIHALAESVNTYFYAVGGGYQGIAGLGVDKITAYGEKFGLSKPTGIDLPAERSGFLPSQEWKLEAKGERWFLGDTYHLAIGQGDIIVTPLQVANFTAVIANGGTLYKPRLVSRIGRAGETLKNIDPVVVEKQVVSPQTVSLIAEGLRSAVTYGSARSLSAIKAPVAGKTGTAEFSSAKDPHAWFTGFAPYKNAEIVVTVMVEEGEGGTIAATPIAKKIFEWYFN